MNSRLPARAPSLAAPEGRPAPLGRLVVSLFALAGAGTLLWMTGHGPGVSADSVGYVAAARALTAGAGWISYTGSPAVVHPPAYPAVLALGALVGVDPAVGARLCNALCFGLTLFVAGSWLLHHVRSGALAVAALATLLLSQPLLEVGGMAWTETLFDLFVIGALVLGGRAYETGGARPLVLCGVLTGLACATRYAGAPLIATGVVLVALGRADPWRQRLLKGAGFAALALLPVGLWLARNLLLAGTVFGGRHPATDGLPGVLAASWTVVASWFLPAPQLVGVRWLAGLAVGAVVVLAAAGLWAGRGRPGPPRGWGPPVPFLVFAALYWAFIVGAKAHIGSMEARYMYPLIAPLVLVLAWVLDRALAAGRAGFRYARAFAVALPLCVLAWLAVYPAPRALGFARLAAREGMPGYTATYWQERPVVQALARLRPQGYVLSNAPDLVYWTTGAHAHWLPARAALRTPAGRRALVARVGARLAAGEAVYVVVVRHEQRPHLADVPDVVPLLSLRVVWGDPDGSGVIFQALGARPGPPAPPGQEDGASSR